MQCLVLAGGLGTRMKSVAGEKPKALLPLGSLTFIDVQLQWLKILGVTDVVMALGHGGEKIAEHIEKVQSDKKYPQVNYSYDGPELLGTGGAIRKALHMLSSDFIVTYGDTVLFLDVRALKKSHADGGKPITMAILKNKDIGDKSNIVMKEGKILSYDKFNITPEMDHIDYGMSLVNKKYFEKNAPAAGVFDYAQVLTAAVKKEQVTPFLVTRWFQEVGSPDGYKKLEELLRSYSFDLKKMAADLI